MPTIGLRACIDVEDLQRGIDFYCAGLGLDLVARRGADLAELCCAGVPIDLIARPAGSRAVPATDVRRVYSRHWTPVHLDFTVADLDAALARAVAAGAVLERLSEPAAWGRMANMADPFGHGFCLVELSVRGYDAL